MLGASNLRQQRRLWTLLERPDMIKRTNDERDAGSRPRDRSADGDHADAHRRRVGGILAGPPRAGRARAHDGRSARRSATREPRYRSPPRSTLHGIEGGFGVPLAAFTFAHGGPQIDSPPPTLGQHNDEIFSELDKGRR